MLHLEKGLLGLFDLEKDKILEILELAKEMKTVVLSGDKKTSHLKGKSVINLFYENSTRTRLSFELAAKYMGANAANISASTSSVAKGETLIDTARTIDMMGADVLIIRHPFSGSPHLLAKNINAKVVNAGDGLNEHPTQALLDMFTMLEKKKSIKGLKVAIIGDIYHSRVARSNIWGLKKLGADVNLFAPSTLMPPFIEDVGVRVSKSITDAVEGADVVMGLRVQLERQKQAFFPSSREYASLFGLNEKVLACADKDCLVMHPGPVNRGIEMDSALVDCGKSVIDEQVLNGVAVRMAVLDLLTRGG